MDLVKQQIEEEPQLKQHTQQPNERVFAFPSFCEDKISCPSARCSNPAEMVNVFGFHLRCSVSIPRHDKNSFSSRGGFSPFFLVGRPIWDTESKPQLNSLLFFSLVDGLFRPKFYEPQQKWYR